ncbi:hypothetical protein TSL6_04340 [Sulfurovum sp. TSL6]|uniref:hypothetical protein n=1 Tax=Sulfurovum sp. TSL6 TaxID=2826995 RepID=UPI001CC7993F|nr:hypothetical protein [Sulfurovum sp. TSL6]GIT99927.1 hypothetical protein TSL6_04340 [Sulfurovum sp. TSL6]
MKSKITIISLSLIIVMYLAFKGFIHILSSSNYKLNSIKSASNTKFIVSEFESLSEAGHAPYGKHLTLSKKPIDTPSEGHIIYAGYCLNLEYSWLSNNRIQVNCRTDKPENPVSLSKTAYGIVVEYN